MVKYIVIVELSLVDRRVVTYEEEQKGLLDEFEEILKSNKISYDIWEIGEYGITRKISCEQYE